MTYYDLKTVKTIYTPVICSKTGQMYYYHFDYATFRGAEEPKWFMQEVLVNIPSDATIQDEVPVGEGYVWFQELKCPHCGTIGFGRHLECGTIFCSDFNSDELYCPKCQKSLDYTGGRIDKLKGNKT